VLKKIKNVNHGCTVESHLIIALFGIEVSKGFSNILSKRATGFHRQANLFELNFSIRKTFL